MKNTAAMKNRETIAHLSNLIEAMFNEVGNLPISDCAKTAVVMIMMGDLTKFNGNRVTFDIPTTAETKNPQQKTCVCVQP
ncbi:MAG: hypothetical protein GF365_05160 [Candidatus Buchananbacteria bacterium]|nr:hypothetical protein [Candidatus Buchananbacteria bacterium]